MASYSLPDAKIPVLQTGNFTLPWYLFLQNIFNSTGQGAGGTVNQVLHGNNAGYSAVALISDVSGVLPLANGGTSVSISPTVSQVLIAQSPTSALWKSISGDVSLNSSGKVTVSGTNGVAFTAYATAAVGQLPGTPTNDNATAGNIGEFVSSTVTSGASISLTSTVVSNVTSISLSAGDWDVSGTVGFTVSNVTTIQMQSGGSSTTSGSIPTTDSGQIFQLAESLTGGVDTVNAIPLNRISVTTPTPVFLVVKATFGVSTMNAYGAIRARRMR